MKDDIRNYAKLGLVHHMLYPKCVDDPEYHVKTLLEFIQRDDIETLDCCLPYGEMYRKKLIPAIKNCGKSACFAIHLYPLRELGLAALTQSRREQIAMLIDDLIICAVAINAEGFILGSGTPSFYDAIPEHFSAFDEFCLDLCAKLKPYNITVMLEPFDMDVDKKFLYGPIDDCVKLAKRINRKYDNFGFELDMAHLPLMGENSPSAIERCAPFLKRVHLGNCVLKDKSSPYWGDTHPPIGFPGGEIDVPELTVILQALLKNGFLNKHNRGNLVLEMIPFPDKTIEETVSDNFSRLGKAWQAI